MLLRISCNSMMQVAFQLVCNVAIFTCQIMFRQSSQSRLTLSMSSAKMPLILFAKVQAAGSTRYNISLAYGKYTPPIHHQCLSQDEQRRLMESKHACKLKTYGVEQPDKACFQPVNLKKATLVTSQISQKAQPEGPRHQEQGPSWEMKQMLTSEGPTPNIPMTKTS